MSLDLDPRVKRFQALKAAAKAKAIARKAAETKQKEAVAQILHASPSLTEKQAIAVYEAHERHKNAETRKIGHRTVKVFRA